MKTNKLFALFPAVAVLAFAGLAWTPSAAAHTSFGISVRIGPPARLYEAYPPPRPGFVWVRGYWRWHSRRYVWTHGRWFPRRAGLVYIAPTWQHSYGAWHFRGGHWAHRVNRYYQPNYREDARNRRVYRHDRSRSEQRGWQQQHHDRRGWSHHSHGRHND